MRTSDSRNAGSRSLHQQCPAELRLGLAGAAHRLLAGPGITLRADPRSQVRDAQVIGIRVPCPVRENNPQVSIEDQARLSRAEDNDFTRAHPLFQQAYLSRVV